MTHSAANALTRPVGVQVHCLRHRMAQDFRVTLADIAALGIRAVELVSFPGCRGNPWGDFGGLADWQPEAIRDALLEAGLTYPSAHVSWRELQEPQFDRTVDWLQRIGVQHAVLASLPLATGASIHEWRRAFEALNSMGERLLGADLQFAYHTQANLWNVVNGMTAADELLLVVDPRRCLLEFDPSGALMYAADPAEYLRRRPDCFFALHLRDGTRPAQQTAYLPALPLGDGALDWPSLFTAAERTSLQWYFLEMEVEPAEATMTAIRTSLHYLQRASLLQPQRSLNA